MPARLLYEITLRRIHKAETASAVLEELFECCRRTGADKFSYHPEIMFEGAASSHAEVFSAGYPQEWVDSYIKAGSQMIDPLPDIVLRAARPMTWMEAVGQISSGAAHQAYVANAIKYGIISGVSFPLWGPKGHNAYLAIGFPNLETRLSENLTNALHMVLLVGHQRVHALTAHDESNPALSMRECEVLTWVGRGKSNTDIASILAISPETVATYTRRIFAKLECHDRIGAVIKALRLGLIRI